MTCSTIPDLFVAGLPLLRQKDLLATMPRMVLGACYCLNSCLNPVYSLRKAFIPFARHGTHSACPTSGLTSHDNAMRILSLA